MSGLVTMYGKLVANTDEQIIPIACTLAGRTATVLPVTLTQRKKWIKLTAKDGLVALQFAKTKTKKRKTLSSKRTHT